MNSSQLVPDRPVYGRQTGEDRVADRKLRPAPLPRSPERDGRESRSSSIFLPIQRSSRDL